MCTAICSRGAFPIFGRTLDLERSYGEGVVTTPRAFPLAFRREGTLRSHMALMGIALVRENTPLYYDAVNEAGLAMAALNFSGSAVYHAPKTGRRNVASFELIPFVLSQCRTVDEAVAHLRTLNVTQDSFAPDLPATPLHWILADKSQTVTVESVAEGLCLYDNPFGVLTNDPPFPYHRLHVADFMQMGSDLPENRLCPSTELIPYSRGMGAMGLPGDFSSASRFVRAVFANHHTEPASGERGAVSRFFHMMDTVAQPWGCVRTREGQPVRTVYTACVNPDTATYYATTYASRRIRAIRLGDVLSDGDSLAVFPLDEEEDIRYLNG